MTRPKAPASSTAIRSPRPDSVGDPVSAARVEVPEPASRFCELAPELGGTGRWCEHRLGIELLGANVEGEPDGLERFLRCRPPEGFHRLGPLEAELARSVSGCE